MPSRASRMRSERHTMNGSGTLTNSAANSAQPLAFWQQLRWNLIIYFVLLAVLPVTLVVFLTLTETSKQATGQIINQLQSVAELKYQQLQSWLHEADDTIDLMMSDSTVADRFAGWLEGDQLNADVQANLNG